MSDDLAAKLIVMDTGPLITLAAADTLDYLLYPGVSVYVPDAVLYEATRDSTALGAAEILAWAQKNSEQVRTISTEAFFNYVESREANPARREKDPGERAAIEAIHDGIHLGPDERAILVTEDDRVLVVQAELTAKMIPITTRDFLEGLKRAQRINSADEVYRQAEDAGRLQQARGACRSTRTRRRRRIALPPIGATRDFGSERQRC